MELFIPIVHAVRHNPAVSRNILTKWQPPIWLGYRKAEVLHAAPTPPTVVSQAWFYIKSIVVLLLIIKHNTSTSVFPSPLTVFEINVGLLAEC